MEKTVNYKVGDKIIRTVDSWGGVKKGDIFIAEYLSDNEPYEQAVGLKGIQGTFYALKFKKESHNKIKLYKRVLT